MEGKMGQGPQRHVSSAKWRLQGYALQFIRHNERLKTADLGHQLHKGGYLCPLEYCVATRATTGAFGVRLWKDRQRT